jgi:hypothetical protein
LFIGLREKVSQRNGRVVEKKNIYINNYPNSHFMFGRGEIKFIPKELKNDVMHAANFRARDQD